MFDDDELINQIGLTKNQFHIVLLEGELGSGKTHFVKEFMKKTYNFYGVSSPTFSFLNVYNLNHITVGHFDCYHKINYDLLLESLYLYDLIFIEWFPECMIDILSSYILINFNHKIYKIFKS